MWKVTYINICYEDERKQLNQMHFLQMNGPPTPRPRNNIVLRPCWQYHIKRNDIHRSRNCCDRSPCAFPVLHVLATTYSSCVEQLIQRLFFALAAAQGLKIYGGNAQDTFAHSPPHKKLQWGQGCVDDESCWVIDSRGSKFGRTSWIVCGDIRNGDNKNHFCGIVLLMNSRCCVLWIGNGCVRPFPEALCIVQHRNSCVQLPFLLSPCYCTHCAGRFLSVATVLRG